MNKEEKIAAISERLKEKGTDIDGAHISSIIIAGYLNDLAELGIIESAYTMTAVGKNVRAICEDFDWSPDDDELMAFVQEAVAKPEQAGFLFMLKKYRDDREGLIKEFKKATEPPAST